MTIEWIGPALAALLFGAGLIATILVAGILQRGRAAQSLRNSNLRLSRLAMQLAASRQQLANRAGQLGHLSRQLVNTNSELERLNHMKSRFLSMVVHDLRTPLTAVQGFANRIVQKAPAPVAEEARHIEQAGERMGRLVSDLTDLAMIEAGKLRTQPAPMDLGDACREVAMSLEVPAKQKEVSLAHDLPSGLWIHGDKFRLGQVFANLLGNAVKFTPPGGRVEAAAFLDGRWVTVRVKDTGPGIAPGERKRVFEKFYQSQNTAGQKEQGWGLGLSISMEIVRQHNGQIGVDSPGLGRGSTFWFKIPAT